VLKGSHIKLSVTRIPKLVTKGACQIIVTFDAKKAAIGKHEMQIPLEVKNGPRYIL